MIPLPLPMHGIGGAKDLPISPQLAITGAVAALIISFSVLALAWRTPRYDGNPDGPVAGRRVPHWMDGVLTSRGFAVAARVLGMVVFLYSAAAAVLGEDLLTNPFFGIFYVWWWIGLVFASALLGPVWKAISPVRTINLAFSKISGSDPDVGLLAYPARLGHWPASLGLFAFVWLELVYPYSTELGPVRLWCAVYVAVMLLGGAIFGNGFYEKADPFEVYSTLIGKLSVWGTHEGRIVVRSPLANLSTVVPTAGLLAVVSVLFGSTAFDSFKDSPFWVRFSQTNELVAGLENGSTIADSLALLVFSAAPALVFAGAAAATMTGPDLRRRDLPAMLAHSIVPIILGYIVAHYASYWFEVGQDTLIKASDPLTTGADYLGTGDWQVNYWLSYHPTLLANIKVGAVVVGHVVAAIASHDRSVALLPPRHQILGQLPLLMAMVAFTSGGLYLLFAA
ncbi:MULTISPECIES: hypothetical protein [Nocardioides]|uniref:Uncharacterized membrane protein HdeD (DUF308 family) n=1 Tax=Nocardioides marinus TaxID=374514 RepID=A0A7Y9YCU8_9ACTN|nr:hypothetical protein [Nocardioides sp. REDSEA-S30_B4]MAY96529.1 hypothetical protein [Nocardioides sp.]NYI09479.1 uncharacterized membrane protein HdeD (DUF308 family) [Nocardioides marinus]